MVTPIVLLICAPSGCVGACSLQIPAVLAAKTTCAATALGCKKFSGKAEADWFLTNWLFGAGGHACRCVALLIGWI